MAKLDPYLTARTAQDYAGAAAHLLDRQPPADYVSEWTERVAAAKHVTRQGVLSVVVFRMAYEYLALPARLFKEVAVQCPFHALPHRSNEVLKGLVNVRGELLLCVSLDGLLGLKSSNQATKAISSTKESLTAESSVTESGTAFEKVLVLDRKGQRFAAPVDEVCAVIRYDRAELTEVPATLATAASRFVLSVLRWRDQTVGCLDDASIFDALNKYLS